MVNFYSDLFIVGTLHNVDDCCSYLKNKVTLDMALLLNRLYLKKRCMMLLTIGILL